MQQCSTKQATCVMQAAHAQQCSICQHAAQHNVVKRFLSDTAYRRRHSWHLNYAKA